MDANSPSAPLACDSKVLAGLPGAWHQGERFTALSGPPLRMSNIRERTRDSPAAMAPGDECKRLLEDDALRALFNCFLVRGDAKSVVREAAVSIDDSSRDIHIQRKHLP